MLWSAAAVLREVEADIPPLLVRERELESCRRVAQTMPAGMSSYYLECRLSESPRVDYLGLMQHRTGIVERFRRARAGLPASAASLRNEALLDAWQAGRGEMADISLVWFEYDIDERLDLAKPDASPSIGVERSYYARFRAPPLIDSNRAVSLAHQGLRPLLDSAEHEQAVNAISRAVAMLPRGGSLVYVSSMITRATNVLKLYIALPRARVVEYLRRIAWPGDVNEVANLLATIYVSGTETAFLDVSIAGAVLPRLGLALSQFQQLEDPESDPAWAHLATPSRFDTKKNALATWPGMREVRIDGLHTWLRRWIDLKLVLNEVGDLDVKAYLGFMPSLPLSFG